MCKGKSDLYLNSVVQFQKGINFMKKIPNRRMNFGNPGNLSSLQRYHVINHWSVVSIYHTDSRSLCTHFCNVSEWQRPLISKNKKFRLSLWYFPCGYEIGQFILRKDNFQLESLFALYPMELIQISRSLFQYCCSLAALLAHKSSRCVFNTHRSCSYSCSVSVSTSRQQLKSVQCSSIIARSK